MHRSELDLIVARRETMAPEVFIRRMLTTPIYFDRFEDLITMHTSAEEEVSPRSQNKISGRPFISSSTLCSGMDSAPRNCLSGRGKLRICSFCCRVWIPSRFRKRCCLCFKTATPI